MTYKLTINLPKTKFQMQADLTNNEKNIAKKWENVTQKIKNKKIFILNDGPPYANGEIHMGHALNKILKDFICKYKNLNGYYINFILGWDCHGLPIELNIEKNIKHIKNIISDKNFRKLCKTYAKKQITIQKNTFKKLGIITNWKNIYKTMDQDFEACIINNFKNMLKNKYIYTGYKPIHWCSTCLSALAEAEVEYFIKKSFSIYITFKIKKKRLLNNKSINLIIWTTTPWTIPFNKAVALNEKYEYIIFETEKKIFAITKKLFYSFKEKTKIKIKKILYLIKSNTLKNSTIIHPIYKKNITIINSNHVKDDAGTGFVHIAPAYGHDDYKSAIKNNIKIKNNINANGYFNKNVIFFKNLNFIKANKIIINFIKINKNLLLKELILHKYPYCWRHKTIIIFKTTKQWFFDINNKKLKKNILNKATKNITWIPEIGKTKINLMIKNRLDWCISRQRNWGVPIILIIKKNNEANTQTLTLITKAIILTKKYGSDFWYNFDINKIFSQKKINIKQITDVLDVWFDSSVVYDYIKKILKTNKTLDMCIEGNDQYRGWFQVSVINSISNYKKEPYKTIITHGFVLDKNGQKMSKSLNNVISPNEIINKYGAEILRLWVSSINYKSDINFSYETIKRICEAYRKIRNTLRFLISNTTDLKIKKIEKITDIDMWILYKFQVIKKIIILENKNFNFYNIYKIFYNFCINDLCSKYFESKKDCLYTTNIERSLTQLTLYIILYNLTKLIYPILTFTSEEIWQYINYKESKLIINSNIKINLIKLNEINFSIKTFITFEKIFNIKKIIYKKIEKFKKKYTITSFLDLKINFLCDIPTYFLLSKNYKNLALYLITSKIKIKKNIKNKKNIIKITKTNNKKCDRCWNRHIKKNYNLKICIRCVKNLYYKIN